MRKLAIAALLVFASLTTPELALGQATVAEPPPIRDVTPAGDSFSNALGELANSDGDVISPRPPPRPASDPASGGIGFTATDEMRAKLGEAIYADYEASLRHNQAVFEWQLKSSRTTFWIVIGLVGVGVAFATIQFAKAMRAPPAADAAATAARLTEMEISTKGLKVSSPVLGVIILVISLGFFYLFLVHVYPIEHVRDAPSSSAPDTPAPAQTPPEF